MDYQYDIFVIGTGTAGYLLAHKCRKAGKKIAVADSRPMGGTCAMRGCQPKKYLVTAAEIAHITHSMDGIGISPPAQIDWPNLLRSKNSFTDRVPDRVKKSFTDEGVDIFEGTVRFLSPEQVMLNADTHIKADHFVVATGSVPAPLNILGEEHVITSEQFMDLPSIPKKILFVGGGYISLEFSHVARAAGAEVTVLERGPQILRRFEPELVEHLHQSTEESGIKIVTNYKVCEVEKKNNGYIVHGDETCTKSYEADLVVHGAGRVAALEALELGAGNIQYSHNGVAVNQYLQSITNPRVYVAGDAVAQSSVLSPVADMEAETAADNILGGNRIKADYENIPSVIFSTPPLAGVGMTEKEAESSEFEYKVNKDSMTSWPSSLRLGQKNAFYKVITEKGSKRILGAHILGYNAGEVINIFALAMKFNLTADDLKKVLWAYPTYTSDLKYMID